MSVTPTTARSQRRRRRTRRQAFTLIEVMMSLGVMTVGAMAIIGLQTHTMRSNIHARHMSQAMYIAQIWAERLKQDAATWNRVADPAVPNDDLAVLGNTLHLQSIAGWATPGEFAPIANAGAAGYSAGFDWSGQDVGTLPGAPVEFCVDHRLSWVYFGRAMRADVRVWWKRSGTSDGQNILQTFAGCDAGILLTPPAGAQLPNYHTVFLPTVIRMVEVVH